MRCVGGRDREVLRLGFELLRRRGEIARREEPARDWALDRMIGKDKVIAL